MIKNGGVLYRDDYVVDESSGEIVLLKIGAGLKKLYLEPTARCNLACLTCMRQQWPSLHDGEMDMAFFERMLEQMKQFPQLEKVHLGGFGEDDAAVIRHDGAVVPCYGLMYSYPYYLDNRRKDVSAHILGNLNESSLYDIWNSAEYLRFRHRVRNFRFPSCMDCSGAAICDYAEVNEDCWGNSPSCADCLWSQGIVRCP